MLALVEGMQVIIDVGHTISRRKINTLLLRRAMATTLLNCETRCVSHSWTRMGNEVLPAILMEWRWDKKHTIIASYLLHVASQKQVGTVVLHTQ